MIVKTRTGHWETMRARAYNKFNNTLPGTTMSREPESSLHKIGACGSASTNISIQYRKGRSQQLHFDALLISMLPIGEKAAAPPTRHGGCGILHISLGAVCHVGQNCSPYIRVDSTAASVTRANRNPDEPLVRKYSPAQRHEGSRQEANAWAAQCITRRRGFARSLNRRMGFSLREA
jgi:hypothetical protein